MSQISAEHLGDKVSPDVACVQSMGSSLADALIDTGASWRVVSKIPLTQGLTLTEKIGGDFSLEWVVPNPGLDRPTKIILTVPKDLPSQQTGWSFKSDLVSNYAHLKGVSSGDLVSTPFFQALMQQGYRVSLIENARIPEVEVAIALDERATLRGCQIHGAIKLACDELNLEDIQAENCKITIRVKTGVWSNVQVKGSKTQIAGDAGTTLICSNCHFDETMWCISLLNARFEADDFFAQLKKTTFQAGTLPRSYSGRTTAISPEEYQQRLKNTEVARSSVTPKDWQQSNDAYTE